MKHAVNAAGHYVLDAFLISYFLVFLMGESENPVPFIWMCTAVAAAAAAGLRAGFKKYRLSENIVISVLAGLAGLLAGLPAWLAAGFMMLTIYRLHAHFAGGEQSIGAKSYFLPAAGILFTAGWIIQTFVPSAETVAWLIGLLVSSVLFYLTYRITIRLMMAESRFRFRDVLKYSLLVAVPPLLAGALVFMFSESGREMLGMMFTTIFGIIFYPFAGLYEAFMNYVSEQIQGGQERIQQDFDQTAEEGVPDDTLQFGERGSSPALSVTAFLAAAAAIGAAALFVWLKRVKPARKQQPSEATHTYQSSSLKPEETAAAEQNGIRPAENGRLNAVRLAVRELDRLAETKGLGRRPSETVHEWAARTDWQSSETFIGNYEKVRYGGFMLPETAAEEFLVESEKLKEKFRKQV